MLKGFLVLQLLGIAINLRSTSSQVAQVVNKSLHRTPDFGYVYFLLHPNSSLQEQNVRQFHAESYKSCAVTCAANKTCLSFNFGKKPIFFYHGKAQYLCEVLSTDKYNSSSKYQSQNTDFDHYSIRSECSKSPCLHNLPCIPNYSEDTYECLCPRPAFEGKHCKDVDECATGLHDCSHNANCFNTIGSYNCTCKTGYYGNGKACMVPASCSVLFSAGYTKDGVYHIDPDGQGSFPVYCDMTTDGGGWTVFQRNRKDSLTSFNHGWQGYKTGFGNQIKEFWLGLEKIYRLTKTQAASLRVDLEDQSGNKKHAVYSSFSIADERDFYRLRVSGYSGTAGDSIGTSSSSPSHNNNMRFSTPDRDNDAFSGSCAAERRAGWWYNYCTISDLNGQRVWSTFTGSLMNTEMKLK